MVTGNGEYEWLPDRHSEKKELISFFVLVALDDF